MTERDKMYAAFQAGAIRHGGRSVPLGAIEKSFAQWYERFKLATEAKVAKKSFSNPPHLDPTKKKP